MPKRVAPKLKPPDVVPGPQELEQMNIKIQEFDKVKQDEHSSSTIDGRSKVIKPISCCSVKMPLKSIVKNAEIYEHLNRLVRETHLVTCRAYELIRLFIISEFKLHEEALARGEDVSNYYVKLPTKAMC